VLSAGLTLITVTGRKTGRRYSIPTGYQQEGDTVVILVSKADRKQWWRNYREPRPIELLLRGHALHGTAHVVPTDTPEFRERVEQALRRLPFLARQFDVDFDRAAGLQPAQLTVLARSCAVVRVTLESA
jgi:hypothetical protein